MRGWAPPGRTWVMAQTWHDLFFAHWPVSAADLGHLIPPPLKLDLWIEQPWIGVIPFRIDRVHPRGMFSVPWLSATPEINVRTYVTYGGKPGVYFFSLHASNPVAVNVAQRFFHLPYFRAAIDVRREGEMVHYEMRGDRVEFRGSYGPNGEVELAQPGTLEYWLTERYCFYTLDKAGSVIRGEVDHEPWRLQRAKASIEANTMTAPFGIHLPASPPLLHFSRAMDVKMWMPERA